MTARASLHDLLREWLAARAPHLRLVSLAVNAAAPGRATWRAELDVGTLEAALAAQLSLVERFDDLKHARLSPAEAAAPSGGRVVEHGDATYDVRGDGAPDAASLRVRSFLFEDLAAMVSITTLAGRANGEDVVLPPYAVGKFPVTQALYALVTGTNPSHFVGDLLRPAEQVSWFDAVRFCNALSRLTGRAAACASGDGEAPDVTAIEQTNGYRLPSEAEWEVAHSAGASTEFFWGHSASDADAYAWFGEDANTGSTHPVGMKAPNSRGLHDTSGNVWEWCVDLLDPAMPLRTARGGSYLNRRGDLYATNRDWGRPEIRGDALGFRCAASLPAGANAAG